jgi:TetR/AcrR family transcriptional repressor of nem operon
MARSKEYDRETVLGRAALLFWKKGYEAASMDDLVAATGLNTFSMYREFGSKNGMFDSAMAWYRRSVLEAMLNKLRANPGLPGIRDFFGAFPPLMTGKKYNGCLFMNTLAERNVVDKKAFNRVAGFCRELTEQFEASIRAAQTRGEVGLKKDPKALAEYLLCVVQGLGLFGRTGADEKAARSVVKTALAPLEG